MTKRIFFTALAMVALAVPAMALAQAQVVNMEGHKMCPHSKLAWHKSPTKVMVVVKASGEVASSQFCFPNLAEGLGQLGEKYGNPKFEQVVVLDFETFGSDEQVFIDGTQAYYLVGAQIGSKVTGGLDIIAFNSKTAAKAKSQEVGGKLAIFNELPALVESYLAGKLEVASGRAEVPAAAPACNT